jgi:hypothetical protein
MRILNEMNCHFVSGGWAVPHDADVNISTAGLSAKCVKALQYWANLAGSERERQIGVFSDYCTHSERTKIAARWDNAITNACGRHP